MCYHCLCVCMPCVHMRGCGANGGWEGNLQESVLSFYCVGSAHQTLGGHAYGWDYLDDINQDLLTLGGIIL